MRSYGEGLYFALLLVFLAISSVALAATDDVTVDVSVAGVTQISVTPETLTWSNVLPGQNSTVKTLGIKNVGSGNVSNIHAYVDTIEDESSRPYGSDNATDYAVGGVIVYKNETDSDYYFAGRLEWNWTEDVGNDDLSAITTPVSWGFFKNTSLEYYWALGNGTDNGFCNNSATEFAIEDDVDNGTVESRTPQTTNIDCSQAQGNYSYCSIERASAPLYGSCVATYYDCSKIYIYRYDKRTGFTDCANSAYIQSTNLVPGETHTLSLNVYMPSGIPSGDLNTSTFTVEAS